MPPIQLFVSACTGYEVVIKPATALSAPSGVWTECEINTGANHFAGFRNLMQMCRLATGVHHKQAAVFQPEVQTIQNAKFKIQNYEEERNF